MSTPAPLNPLNPLLQPSGYHLVTGRTGTPDGPLGIITIRHVAGEVTAFLTRDEIRSWADALAALAGQMSPSGIEVIRGATIPRGNGRP